MWQRLLVVLAMVTMAWQPTAARPPLQMERGRLDGAAWTCARVDPRALDVDLVTFGRTAGGWGARRGGLDEVPADCRVAMNGTFFSLKYDEPAGILVYGGGREQWSPRFKRPYDGVNRAVVRLPRFYLAAFRDGALEIGDSEGRGVAEVRRRLEARPRTDGRNEPDGRQGPVGRHGGLRSLLGGLGLLVHEGRVAITPASLAHEGFDERSGLRPEAAVARSALGIAADGRLLFLVCGIDGGGLPLPRVADLLVSLGAREAVFCDCGSSTALRVDRWRYTQGRAVPVWIVAHKKG